MKNAALKVVTVRTDPGPGTDAANAPHPTIGRVVELDAAKVPLVDYPGNPHGALRARLTLSAVDADHLAKRWQDTDVLLVFVDSDPSQPVITGLVRHTLDDPSYVADWEGFRQLLLTAEEELVLQCGDAKIVLRRDGNLTIIGKEILSRARHRNRIRGATVDIN